MIDPHDGAVLAKEIERIMRNAMKDLPPVRQERYELLLNVIENARDIVAEMEADEANLEAVSNAADRTGAAIVLQLIMADFMATGKTVLGNVEDEIVVIAKQVAREVLSDWVKDRLRDLHPGGA